MHQGVIEEDEPVDGESAGILQAQSFVAALADEPAVRRLQRVLPTHDDSRHPRARAARLDMVPGELYRHLAREALPEMKCVFDLFSPPLQLDGQSFKLGGAVLQPLVLRGRLSTENLILSRRYKTCSGDLTSITHHFKAGGQFEQQPAVFWKVLSREVEEGHQEVDHGDVVLAALRQPLKQLGALPKEIAGKTSIQQ